MATNTTEDKGAIAHLDEKDLGGKTHELEFKVDDQVAGDYVDPTLEISPEENRRLRGIIYKR